MKGHTRIVNALWSLATRRDAVAFERNAARARGIQERRLLRVIARNRDTAFGREHRFDEIGSLGDFRDRVPIRTYEDLAPWIERAAAGEEGVLTSEPVLLFEPTGGTHGGTKLIPYTETLRTELRRAVAPWIRDVFRRYPRTRWGRGYWSISPQVRTAARTSGGIAIGFDDDSGYLGRAGAFIARTFVVPPELRLVSDVDEFLYLTALCLLRAGDLTIVSVWNPTMLTLLIDTIERNVEALIRDVRAGRDIAGRRLRGDGARAAALESVLARPRAERYERIWPRLELVSCWADGAARMHVARVRELFPRAHLQPKGLVATEGVISIPLGGDDAQVPAYNAHFLEFEPVDGRRERCLDELEHSREYSVVLTTGGGLYRYRLKDRVRVVGRYLGLPCLRFVGREETCDLVGEKLDEVHVRRVIEGTLAEEGLEAGFVMMAPEPSDRGGRYALFVALGVPQDGAIDERVRRRVEEGLRENFHYRHARDLGQLEPLRLSRVGPGAEAAYVGRCLDEGQRLGDIKPVYLDRRSGWDEVLEGESVGASS